MRFAAQQALLIAAGAGLIALPLSGTVSEIVLTRDTHAASEIPLFRGYGSTLLMLAFARVLFRRAWVTRPEGWLGRRFGPIRLDPAGRGFGAKTIRLFLHVDAAGRDRDSMA